MVDVIAISVVWRFLKHFMHVAVLTVGLASAGCSMSHVATGPSLPAIDPLYVAMYSEIAGDKHPIAATDISDVQE